MRASACSGESGASETAAETAWYGSSAEIVISGSASLSAYREEDMMRSPPLLVVGADERKRDSEIR
jgi:hypothetical protein